MTGLGEREPRAHRVQEMGAISETAGLSLT